MCALTEYALASWCSGTPRQGSCIVSPIAAWAHQFHPSILATTSLELGRGLGLMNIVANRGHDVSL